MSYFIVCLLLVLVLCFLLSTINFCLEKSFNDKGSSFECGFYSFSGSSLSFSMPFFLISLMFLLFDVEILLLCLFPLCYSFSSYSSFFIFLISFVILISTLYEWLKGVLSWI